MNKLYSWLLRRFLLAFIILVAVQLLSYVIGLNIILSGYENYQLQQYEQIAAEVLINPDRFDPADAPSVSPFFVFSADGQLIFSNRGKGKSINTDELRPVYVDGAAAGYFHVGELGFAENQSNRLFLTSIIILSAVSIVLSLVIGFISARLSSRKISEPIRELRNDIHDIRNMKKIPRRDFSISELADMSADIEGVSNSLSSQEEYKQKWLSDLAHDLRTPLAGLRSQLEAMADGVLEPTEERFRRHLAEIARLEDLAASTAELSAIELRNKIEKDHVSSEGFIRQLITPYEAELDDRGIALKTRIDAESIFCDEKLMLRAVGNILSNAIKYIGDGDEISIKVSGGSRTSITVSNNGPDLPAEQRELIFSRLYRGDSGRSTPGSGLGLAITREIVNLHGGEVRVEQLTVDGEYARGARFIIVV